MPAYLNHVACAVPPHERQAEFLASLPRWAGPPEIVEKLQKIAASAQIDTRHTVLAQPFGEDGFYQPGRFPTTGERMKTYQREAPRLALDAVAKLRAQVELGNRGSGSLRPQLEGSASALPARPALTRHSAALDRVTHLIVTSCTGFYAPGLDIDILRDAKLAPNVQRTLIGFMGCHAGLIGLRSAKQIVEADPRAVVLMVNLELCSLHLQQTERIDRLVSYLLFADGCAASLITAEPRGLRVDECASHLSLADAERMAWHVEDSGFAMTLDARLPARIRQWLEGERAFAAGAPQLWAVHPGGRLILDAVQDACGLTDEQMHLSREVLRRFGNMSSASIMFILRDLLASGARGSGRALAFGPGLTVETMDFTSELGTA